MKTKNNRKNFTYYVFPNLKNEETELSLIISN